MNLLIIGSGGREHTLAVRLSKDPHVKNIYLAPGNGGSQLKFNNIDIQGDETDKLKDFAIKNEIDLTIIGPEYPLSLGIVDEFEDAGLKIFGPRKTEAQLETSKDYSKDFMIRHNIDTARYEAFTDVDEAVSALENYNYPVVIKADGLAAGKGVIIAEDKAQAIETIKDMLEEDLFGDASSKIIIEEFLDGIEMSLLCLVSKNKIVPLESAKDYKRIFDNDQGPNTGGVGCYSPNELMTAELKEKINTEILPKIEKGLEADGLDFTGVLFIGFMVVDGRAYVLEFNTRFGDPETQVVLPRLEGNFSEILLAAVDGDLTADMLSWKDEKALTVIMCSENYPDTPIVNREITGIDNLDEDIILFHNGTKIKDEKLFTSGGRVLSVTTLGNNLEEMRERIYKNIEKIHFEGAQYRSDIGYGIDGGNNED